jgi:hypothetical protein
VTRHPGEDDPEWPRCDTCHQFEPCECVGLCDFCLMLLSRGDPHPCRRTDGVLSWQRARCKTLAPDEIAAILHNYPLQEG